MKIQNCRSCGAKIIWAYSWKEPGKTMPVDAMPRPDGNIQLTYAAYDVLPRAVYLTKRVREAIDRSGSLPDLYASHFVTCPQALAWRKEKEKEKA